MKKNDPKRDGWKKKCGRGTVIRVRVEDEDEVRLWSRLHVGPGPVRRLGHRSLVGPISIRTPDRCPDIQIDVSVTRLQHFETMVLDWRSKT